MFCTPHCSRFSCCSRFSPAEAFVPVRRLMRRCTRIPADALGSPLHNRAFVHATYIETLELVTLLMPHCLASLPPVRALHTLMLSMTCDDEMLMMCASASLKLSA